MVHLSRRVRVDYAGRDASAEYTRSQDRVHTIWRNRLRPRQPDGNISDTHHGSSILELCKGHRNERTQLQSYSADGVAQMLGDMDYMRAAIEEALAAERDGEVPVGAVVVCAGEIVGRGNNRVLRDS